MVPKPSKPRRKAAPARKAQPARRPAVRRTRGPEGLGYVDGKVLDLAKATIRLNDRGSLLGAGVFETLRPVNGKVFRLDDHAARLRPSPKAIGLGHPVENEC